jgi:hypothetical protein
LAWLKAATVPRPTAAINAAENIKRFIEKSSPLARRLGQPFHDGVS